MLRYFANSLPFSGSRSFTKFTNQDRISMFCWESQDTAACALPSGLGCLVDSAEIENKYNMQGAKKASIQQILLYNNMYKE